jgi:ABC-type dipeptide/oligopeptide/nickel transport system permease subunit
VGDSRWLAVGPGLVITITVVAVQRLGDALQSVLDVRLSR